MSKTKSFVGFQLAADDLARLDTLANQHGCSRAEAARLALRFGLPLALRGHWINLNRVALLVEYTQAAVDVIVHREHADAAPKIEQIARSRMEQFHAQK